MVHFNEVKKEKKIDVQVKNEAAGTKEEEEEEFLPIFFSSGMSVNGSAHVGAANVNTHTHTRVEPVNSQNDKR